MIKTGVVLIGGQCSHESSLCYPPNYSILDSQIIYRSYISVSTIQNHLIKCTHAIVINAVPS